MIEWLSLKGKSGEGLVTPSCSTQGVIMTQLEKCPV